MSNLVESQCEMYERFTKRCKGTDLFSKYKINKVKSCLFARFICKTSKKHALDFVFLQFYCIFAKRNRNNNCKQD